MENGNWKLEWDCCVKFAVFDILQNMIGFIWMRARSSRAKKKAVSRNQILMNQSSFIASHPEINHSLKRAANRAIRSAAAQRTHI